MAKRFTDTEKWRDEWWGSLNNDYRIIWLYLVDSCSIAGIWKKDFRGLNFNCNTNVTEETFFAVFKDRLIDRGNFYFIPKFLRFQCPKGLNSNKPAIISIVKELEINNLIQTVQQSLGNDFLIIKGKGTGKDKDKETGKDKEMEGVQGKPEQPTIPFSEYEAWTEAIISGTDHLFTNMLRKLPVKPNGHLPELARSHLALLAKYPKMQPQDQQRFRTSALSHIEKELKNENNQQHTSRKPPAISAHTDGATDYTRKL